MNKTIRYLLLGAAGLIVLYAATSWKAYQGMFEYNALCRKDAGLHVYEKLEKNVGWEAHYSQRGTLKDFTHIGFMRAKNDKGQLVDITYKGGAPEWKDDSYNMVPANLSVPVKYRIEDADVRPIRLDSKINRVVWSITNLSNKNKSIETIQYSNHSHPFKKFIQPQGVVRCPQGDDYPNMAKLNKTIFKD